MKIIERNTIGEAHETVIKEIFLSGEVVNTKHGTTLEYPDAIAIKILHPLEECRISSAAAFTAEMSAIYSSQLQSVLEKTGTNKDFDYNCGNRWFDYPQVCFNTILGDGNHTGFNQVDKMVIEEIQKDHSSRRAIICSLNPVLDYTLKHIPCISLLQFLYRGGQLNCEVYTRSNDMLSAWGADAYALSNFHDYIAKRLNIPLGYIEIISVSAHIYYMRDAPELLRFRRKGNF
jgi:thymidylate synthase